jgi:protein subunit release factor B
LVRLPPISGCLRRAPVEDSQQMAELEIPESDDELLAQCTVDTFRSGGPGGQHQNVTESGVRLRHLPTGIVVTCRARRSQLQNKATCLQRLRERLVAVGREAQPRRPTKASPAAVERRLAEKARRAQKKRERSAPPEIG